MTPEASSPNLAEIRRAADLLLDAGNLSGAFRLYCLGAEHADPQDSDWTWFTALAGEAQWRLGQVAEAERLLRAALTTETGDLNPYLLLRLGANTRRSRTHQRSQTVFLRRVSLDRRRTLRGRR